VSASCRPVSDQRIETKSASSETMMANRPDRGQADHLVEVELQHRGGQHRDGYAIGPRSPGRRSVEAIPMGGGVGMGSLTVVETGAVRPTDAILSLRPRLERRWSGVAPSRRPSPALSMPRRAEGRGGVNAFDPASPNSKGRDVSFRSIPQRQRARPRGRALRTGFPGRLEAVLDLDPEGPGRVRL